MSKYLVAILVALVLLQLNHECEAGVLTLFGEKTETLGKKIHVGSVKVEDKITGIFSKSSENKKEVEVPETPALPPLDIPKNNAKTALNPDDRHTIEGAPRCAPGEVYAENECRPKDR